MAKLFLKWLKKTKTLQSPGLWHHVLWAPQLKGWQSPGLFRRPFFKNNRVFGLFPIRKITALATDIRLVPRLRRNRVPFPLYFLITPPFGDSLERFDCCLPFLLFYLFIFGKENYFWEKRAIEKLASQTRHVKAQPSTSFISSAPERVKRLLWARASTWQYPSYFFFTLPSSFLIPADGEQAKACWPSSEASAYSWNKMTVENNNNENAVFTRYASARERGVNVLDLEEV